MKSKKKIIVLFAVLVLMAVFCTEGFAEKTFPIGAYWPMTGPQAYYGRVMSRGALTAVDQINAAGGVEGYKFKLVITDFKNVDVNLAVTDGDWRVRSAKWERATEAAFTR